jgi:mRNA-degrading endonuclease RelE of RelBE toxin-antitoxin system
MHKTTSRFWICFEYLPEDIRKIAKKNFELLKNNPYHPSLHFKKVGKFWSVRIGINHRAIAIEDGKDFIWVWVGKHDEYKQIINEI